MAKFIYSILTIFCLISAVLNENQKLPVIGVLTVPLTTNFFKVDASYQRWLEATEQILLPSVPILLKIKLSQL
jgi:hypothetical protein